MGRIRTQRRSLSALLKDTTLVAVDQNHFAIQFPAAASFNKSMAEKGDNRILIENIGQQVLGTAARFSFALASAPVPTRTQPAAPAAPAPAPAQLSSIQEQAKGVERNGSLAMPPSPAPTTPRVAQAPKQDMDDLAALLASGFGMGITLTEVDD